MNILPLFKSHYSLSRSILTLEEPLNKKKEPVKNSIFHLLKENNLKDLILVEDNLTGLLEASQISEKNNINLYFGLRITIVNDATEKSEESLKKESKYIIFVKNHSGYKRLIKSWSWAANQGFYYQPRIDFKTLKEFWDNKDLKLSIPFYDSFLHLNTLESHNHIPDYSFIKNSTCFLEDNTLPFDDFLFDKTEKFANEYKLETQKTQSIYYKSPDDYIAWLAFKCLGNRSSLERPDFQHNCSDTFNFDRWLQNNK